eukprot:6194461-Pleurochrysis_carterae.AAC.2
MSDAKVVPSQGAPSLHSQLVSIPVERAAVTIEWRQDESTIALLIQARPSSKCWDQPVHDDV